MTTAATIARVGHRGLTIHALRDGQTLCGAERSFGRTRPVRPSLGSSDFVTCARCASKATR